jgi:RNA polymerase sigma factor (sigma-70 family)
MGRKEMKALDDNRIVELFLLRDETAIKQTIEKYGSRLRFLAYGIVNDLQTAEECENDTYMEAWNTIPPHEPRDYLYAFLARITRHISLNRCRDRRRLKRSAFISELSAEMEQCIPSPNDVECRIDDMALGEAINSFLSKLGEEKRNIFVRRYWYLDSVADISKRYDLSESKVKITLFRCRNGLREHLEKEGYTL